MLIRCLGFLLLIHSYGTLGSAQVPDATVISVSGTAVVREAKRAETRRLKKGDKLYSGQRIFCADGCTALTISYCKVKVPVARGPKGRLIVSINCGALDGVRAGGQKGEGVSIVFPKESERVRPENFVVRWKPTESPIKLGIRVYLGEKLWGPEDVGGRKGSFTSDSLVESLKNAQKVGDLHLVLTLEVGTESPQRVKFDLISALDQPIVDEKLKVFADEADGVLKALGRGLVFSEYELYGEAVEELEKTLGLSQAPNADKANLIELIKLSIRVNYMAYNDERLKQLCTSPQLPASSAPDVCSIISK